MAKAKAQEQNQNQYFIYAIPSMRVITPIIAPFLPKQDPFKKRVLELLKECYRKYSNSDDVMSLVDHLDNAFTRDAFCYPFINARVFTKTIREYAVAKGLVESARQEEIVAEGMFRFDPSKVIINTKPILDTLSSVTFEMVMPTELVNITDIPGLQTKSLLIVYSPVELPQAIEVHMMHGAKKGYGLVVLNLEKVGTTPTPPTNILLKKKKQS